ncbi:MAG TPA: 7TM diverse intracellular signaling domain-containing protein [Cyclobacteriaceae bacterium]|nr:7TM diverse intracellular signaling domain-containing protein [Cyclobacteriaceae bacterium]
MKGLRFLLVLLIGFTGYSPALAQDTLVLRDHESVRPISPYAWIFSKPSGSNAFDVVMQADGKQFKHNVPPLEIDYGLDQPSGWCRFVVRNESANQDWIVKLQPSRVDTARLYVVRGNQTPEVFPVTGHFQLLLQRPVTSLPFGYRIRINTGETITGYLYTARQFGKHAPAVELQTVNHFEGYEYGYNLVLGFVTGMVVLAAFVGFLLYLFTRQRLYVLYSAYALSFFFVLLVDSGFIHATGILYYDETVSNGYTMVFYYWMGACLGAFTIELLQLKHYGPRWVYYFGVILSATLASFAFILLVPGLPASLRWAMVSASYYFAFVINAYIMYVIVTSVRKKEPIVYFYMVGFFLTSTVALIILFTDFQILPFQITNKDIFFLTPLLEILFVALGIGIQYSRTLRDRVKVQQALNQTQDQLLTVQEDERRRIAQDLHDDVGNSLAAVRNMVVHAFEPSAVEKEINAIIENVRTISHDLMPVDFEQFPLVDMVSQRVTKFRLDERITIDFDCTGVVVRLKPITELVIYRIINELITNVYKHARAKKAYIQFIYQENSLVVTVEDDGVGFNDAPSEGIGLRSIRLRSAYIRAQLKMESDGKGTLIILEVPYEDNRR